MKIKTVQLITVTTAVGRGANEGVYPPGGLLTIAKAVQDNLPDIKIDIHDQHHEKIKINPQADIVGIQVASTLCYKNALIIVKQAKALDKIVVLGGPHITALYKNIMARRPEIDFAIRGKGEKSFVALLKALEQKASLSDISGLSWRDNRKVIHNDLTDQSWHYDNYTPLPLNLLTANITNYWTAFQNTNQEKADFSFLLFTHFGCLYKQRRIEATGGHDHSLQSNQTMPFCSFCSLDEQSITRQPKAMIAELRFYIEHYGIPKKSNITLKCYGDNIGPQVKLLEQLAQAIECCPWWKNYNISWLFYCQSSYLNEKTAQLLKRVGTSKIFIGFDSVNDRIQRINGLGTSKKTHLRAVQLCLKYGIKIQAASVVGLMGETPETLEELYQFFKEICQYPGLIDRVNSAIFFIIPNTPAYYMLVEKEPHIKDLDLLPTSEIRRLWIKHFCPEVNLSVLEEYANKIDALSPKTHASMGYESSLLKNS